MRDLSLENPIRAIREISHDITCRSKVRLANGRELSALEIQTEYYEKTARFIERRGADEPLERAARRVGAALDALAARRARTAGPQGRLGDEARPDRALHGQARPLARPPRIALMDLAYHEVNRDRGLYYLLERAGPWSGS